MCRRDFPAHSASRKRHKIALPSAGCGGAADADFLPNRWRCSRLGVATRGSTPKPRNFRTILFQWFRPVVRGVSRNWWDVTGTDMTGQEIVDLGAVNALGIAIDRDGHAPAGWLA